LTELKSLKQTRNTHIRISPVQECTPPEEWVDSNLIDFDQFLKEDSDQPLIEKLRNTIATEYSYSDIYKIIEALSSQTRDKIISSIWSSCLSDPNAQSPNRNEIEAKVMLYLSKNTAHTALEAAVKNLTSSF
jgi:hypothetical protein